MRGTTTGTRGVTWRRHEDTIWVASRGQGVPPLGFGGATPNDMRGTILVVWGAPPEWQFCTFSPGNILSCLNICSNNNNGFMVAIKPVFGCKRWFYGQKHFFQCGSEQHLFWFSSFSSRHLTAEPTGQSLAVCYQTIHGYGRLRANHCHPKSFNLTTIQPELQWLFRVAVCFLHFVPDWLP